MNWRFWDSKQDAVQPQNYTMVPALQSSSPLGGETASGVNIDEGVVMGLPAVFAAVNILAESIASLPLQLLRTSGTSSVQVDDHVLARMLLQPNLRDTMNEVVSTLVASLVFRHAAYGRIERDASVVRITPLDFHSVEVQVNKYGAPRYRLRHLDGTHEDLPAEEVLHLTGPGHSPLQVLRDALGGVWANELVAFRTQANASWGGGFLRIPGSISIQAQQDLEEQLNQFRGAVNAGTTPIFSGTGGAHQAEFIRTTQSNADMQLLENRRFDIETIARVFRVPTYLLQHDAQRQNRATAQEQSMAFVRYSIRPWTVRIEERLNRSLLTRREQRLGMHFSFDTTALVRADAQSRYESYRTALAAGFMTQNEVRKLENLPPVDGGDKLLTPLNMAPSSDGETESA